MSELAQIQTERLTYVNRAALVACLIAVWLLGILSATLMLWSLLRLVRAGFLTSGEWFILAISSGLFLACFVWVWRSNGGASTKWSSLTQEALSKCDKSALPKEIARLARSFANRLETRGSSSEFSPASFPGVTEFVRQHRNELMGNPDLFLEATSFFGEVLRRELDGVWEWKRFPRTALVVRLGKGRSRHDLSPGFWISQVAESSAISLTEVYENEQEELVTDIPRK